MMGAKLKGDDKYPKTGQIANVIYDVRSRLLSEEGELPTLKFKGTVKLHGTSGGVRFTRTEDSGLDTDYLSRNRVLSHTEDNHGFWNWFHENEDRQVWLESFRSYLMWPLEIVAPEMRPQEVVIYGEFCGSGIADTVGICQLPKMFVIFAAKVDGVMHRPEFNGNELFGLRQANACGIYDIDQFKTYEKTIDFNDTFQTTVEIVDLVKEVEKECPVAAHFGISGIGEGIVWHSVDHNDLIFKAKGEAHTKSKVKAMTIADSRNLIDTADFAKRILHEDRLLQSIDYLTETQCELTKSSTGIFISHAVTDCLEEEALTIAASGFETRKVGKQLSHIAKVWYFKYINDLLMERAA